MGGQLRRLGSRVNAAANDHQFVSATFGLRVQKVSSVPLKPVSRATRSVKLVQLGMDAETTERPAGHVTRRARAPIDQSGKGKQRSVQVRIEPDSEIGAGHLGGESNREASKYMWPFRSPANGVQHATEVRLNQLTAKTHLQALRSCLRQCWQN
jgi:hypothetical protein